MNANIWEFSLYFPRELFCYFEDLKSELKSYFSNQKNCIDILIKEDCYVFIIALEKEIYDKNILQIKEKIAEIILLYYKPKTIINSIQNFDISNGENIILIDILSSYETNIDKISIIENLSLLNQLYLDSFVKFRLGFLTKKWTDVANLINENSLFLMDKGIKKELMQFLMQGLTNYTTEITLSQNGIENSGLIVKKKSIFYAKYDYDNILFTIINLSPKIVNVENYKSFDIQFLETLRVLFGDRLKISE